MINKLPIDFKPKSLMHIYSKPTWPMWKCVAEFIIKQKSKKILDVGSGFGCPLMLNKFLLDYDYEYFGFDVGKELIDYAKSLYNTPNIKFCNADWNLIDIQEEFDCMLLMGVLPYGKSPWNLYKFLSNKFKTKQIIIRETEGKEWRGIKLVDLTNFEKIANEIKRFDVSEVYDQNDSVLGKKVVYNVITNQ